MCQVGVIIFSTFGARDFGVTDLRMKENTGGPMRKADMKYMV